MEITGASKIVFVLADPVGHVRASHFLNRHFTEQGKNAAAVPLHVTPGNLEQVVQAIRLMGNVAGFGVTIPHKIAIMDHLDDCSAAARQIGAVNFVCREADGRLVGDNIDGAGFIAGLRRHGFDPQGYRVLMVGAGGAARALGFALAQAGAASLQICNRSMAKAAALAEEIHQTVTTCQTSAAQPENLDFDLIVNATSLGMKPYDALPLELDGLSPATLVADIIINPLKTRWLALAEQQGCQILNGIPILDAQMQLAAGHMKI